MKGWQFFSMTAVMVVLSAGHNANAYNPKRDIFSSLQAIAVAEDSLLLYNTSGSIFAVASKKGASHVVDLKHAPLAANRAFVYWSSNSNVFAYSLSNRTSALLRKLPFEPAEAEMNDRFGLFMRKDSAAAQAVGVNLSSGAILWTNRSISGAQFLKGTNVYCIQESGSESPLGVSRRSFSLSVVDAWTGKTRWTSPTPLRAFEPQDFSIAECSNAVLIKSIGTLYKIDRTTGMSLDAPSEARLLVEGDECLFIKQKVVFDPLVGPSNSVPEIFSFTAGKTEKLAALDFEFSRAQLLPGRGLLLVKNPSQGNTLPERSGHGLTQCIDLRTGGRLWEIKGAFLASSNATLWTIERISGTPARYGVWSYNLETGASTKELELPPNFF